jgi:hypothetical protein
MKAYADKVAYSKQTLSLNASACTGKSSTGTSRSAQFFVNNLADRSVGKSLNSDALLEHFERRDARF